MNDKNTYPPGLEERFTPSPGWRWHIFKTPRGYRLRFGSVTPPGGVPDAIVIGLGGLSEYAEKYFELARDLSARNLGFWTMDWRGQGKSDRGAAKGSRRHATDFDDDIADLHYFIAEYVRHSAVHPDVGRIPLVMIAHSMGANIGLRYIAANPGVFAAAAFSAPMFGIHALSKVPPVMRTLLTGATNGLFGKSVVGFGSAAWSPAVREDPKLNVFSTDDVRRKIHNAWCLHDPGLQCGNITYGWLAAANASCARLFTKDALAGVDIPVLIGLAGQESLVDNAAARAVAGKLANAKVMEFPQSKHEILMERDDVRGAFLDAFFALLSENRVKEKLKPF